MAEPLKHFHFWCLQSDRSRRGFSSRKVWQTADLDATGPSVFWMQYLARGAGRTGYSRVYLAALFFARGNTFSEGTCIEMSHFAPLPEKNRQGIGTWEWCVLSARGYCKKPG
jgi:hypothetical protein